MSGAAISQSPLFVPSKVHKLSLPTTLRAEVSLNTPSAVRSGVYVCFDQTIGISDLDFVFGC
jgi:hypothetical protein